MRSTKPSLRYTSIARVLSEYTWRNGVKPRSIADQCDRATGNLLCLCLPMRTNPTVTRELYGAGGFDSGNPVGTDAVSFRFEHCR